MEINQYPLIATVINDEDWYDVDFWNGTGWETRKIAGSTLKTILGENIYNSDGTIDGIRRITLTNSGDKIIVKGGVNENLLQVSSDDVSGYEFSTDDELVKWSVVRGTDNVFYIRRHNPSTGALVQVPFYINTDGSIGFAAYVFPLTDGEANQALMTDGAGTLFFGEPTATSAKREIVPFINKTGAPVTEGTIVYLKTTSSSGTYPEIVLATASTEVGSSKTIGAIYETTANDAVGYIVTSGEVDNLDTSMYAIGDRLWLSTTAGQVTTTAPTAPNHAVFIGTVTRAQNGNGRILYAIQNGYELQELHNVSITSTPNDGDALVYDFATSLWKAKKIVPSVQSVTSSATVTATSTNDLVKITAQAAGLTLANPTGTFAEGQALIYRIKDNGTARSITFGTKFRALGVTLPTTTTISKTTYVGCIYNSTDDKFDVVASLTEA